LNSLKNLGLGTRTLVMGILNVTPDSFSDGGRYDVLDTAMQHASEMVEDGADIIDIGGESTRPATFADNTPLDIDEELRRVLPIIRRVAQELPEVPISIDTYKAEVARQALDAGASIINDISGLTYDSDMAKVAADSGCPVVLMHIVGSPRKITTPDYVDVVADICAFFERRLAYAAAEGIERERIILDPGIGFGKNAEHNLTILKRMREFQYLGLPLLIGPSRKKFIGKILDNAPPTERLEGTAAAVAISIAGGADIVRVHDVKEIAKVVKVADAIVRS
jgi:dihydropteroate synthase